MKYRWLRNIRHRVAICVLAYSSVVSSAADQQHPYRNPASICVSITGIDHVSGPAATRMREEATRIWLRHGMALTWGDHVRNCDAVAPLVFDDTQVRKPGGGGQRDHDRALARTVFLGRRQIIYVSAPRVFEMLSVFEYSEGERDVYGGRLLGRVVAHELGHLLLTTLSHSDTGLMRPVVDVREIFSIDDEVTAISKADTTRLALRFSLVPDSVS